MPGRHTVALLRTSPATVLNDYCRLLDLAAPALPKTPPAAVVALGRAGHALPGERVEPWQLDGALRALAAWGCPPPAVALPGDDPADPLAGVARASCVAVQPPGPPPAPAVYLCGAGQAERLVELTLAAPPPALCVVDAVTVRAGVGDSTRLDIRGALLASADPLALAALLARLTGQPLRGPQAAALSHVELVGDGELAACGWAPAPTAGPTTALGRLAARFAYAAGLALPAEQRAYEDWVFYTSWGRLYRVYQRRAIARMG